MALPLHPSTAMADPEDKETDNLQTQLAEVLHGERPARDFLQQQFSENPLRTLAGSAAVGATSAVILNSLQSEGRAGQVLRSAFSLAGAVAFKVAATNLAARLSQHPHDRSQ